jgi:DNA polymerase-3 subunit alpha
MTNFVHLSNKTEYSLSEGAITINRIAELCESFQMPAVGITDTNNMFGALEFSDKISRYGVQPLIGCNIKISIPNEYKSDMMDLDNNFFFINLFAKNLEGYQNLLELSSLSYTKYPEHNAVSLSDIYNKKEGLIALTGGRNNLIDIILNSGKTSYANQFLLNLKEQFNDNLYIEIQRLGNSNKKNENSLLNLAYDISLPLVATNEVYFESPEYYEAHDALSCIEKKAICFTIE